MNLKSIKVSRQVDLAGKLECGPCIDLIGSNSGTTNLDMKPFQDFIDNFDLINK